MNALASARPSSRPLANPVLVMAAPGTSQAGASRPAALRHVHRPRDFGVGYGNSSGYASDKRYTPLWGQPRFKFG